MYADQRYIPRTPRSVSLGGSLAVSGLLIAGLMSFVPNIIPRTLDGPIETYNVPIPPDPEPIAIEKPKTATEPTQPLPYVPPTTFTDPQRPVIESTNVIPTEPPQPTFVEKVGPVTIEQPPAALPPLIGAQQDLRFARDFQPEYPAPELRAQRDGKVAVRVLIGADGRVKAVEQVSATSAAFFDATRRQALSKWRFKPANRGGVPQESWKVMNVRFELKNA